MLLLNLIPLSGFYPQRWNPRKRKKIRVVFNFSKLQKVLHTPPIRDLLGHNLFSRNETWSLDTDQGQSTDRRGQWCPWREELCLLNALARGQVPSLIFLLSWLESNRCLTNVSRILGGATVCNLLTKLCKREERVFHLFPWDNSWLMTSETWKWSWNPQYLAALFIPSVSREPGHLVLPGGCKFVHWFHLLGFAAQQHLGQDRV